MKIIQKIKKKKKITYFDLLLGFIIETNQEYIVLFSRYFEIILIFSNTGLKNKVKNFLVFFKLKKNNFFSKNSERNFLKFYTGYFGILKNGILYKLTQNFFLDYHRRFIILKMLKKLGKRCEIEIKLTLNDYFWAKIHSVNFLIFLEFFSNLSLCSLTG